MKNKVFKNWEAVIKSLKIYLDRLMSFVINLWAK